MPQQQQKEIKPKSFIPDTNTKQEPTAPDFVIPQKETRPQPPAPEVTPPLTRERPVPLPTEKEIVPEQPQEKIEIKKDGFLDDAIEGLKNTLKRPKKKKPTKIPQVRDDLTIQIEETMETGLKDAFAELTPIQKQEFKIKGEQTALQIRQLLKSTHVKVKKIVRLLIEWLKLLPGVNKFFLEQEAKIKADRIMTLKNFFQKKK